MFGGSGNLNTEDETMDRVAAPAESSDLSQNSAHVAHGGPVSERMAPNVSSAHTNVGVTQQTEMPVEKELVDELMQRIQQVESQMSAMTLSNANSSGDKAANKEPADLRIPELEKLMQTLELNQTEQPVSPSSVNEPVSNTLPEIIPSKDWHSTISLDVRNHLVKKITYALFPRCHDPKILIDKRIQRLVTCCHKIERDMYAKANTREEYYQLIAQKIFSIQIDLEDKKSALFDAQLKCLKEIGNNGSITNSELKQLLDMLKRSLSNDQHRDLLQTIYANPTLRGYLIQARQTLVPQKLVGHSNVSSEFCKAPVCHHLEAAGVLIEPSLNCLKNRASLHHLLHLIKSPSSSEQQQQILQILRSNPCLMASFIKQRQQVAARHRKNIAFSSGKLRR